MDSSLKNFPAMWNPDEKSGKMTKKLMKFVEDRYHTKFNDYWSFHQWSVDNIAEFWAVMWDFTGIVYSKKYDQVIDLTIPMEESPKWFEGAELNYAENLLKYRDDYVALILAGEDKEAEKMTYAQLYEETALYAAAFRKFGLKKGDIVACYMSNRKEAVMGMLATISLGAIWTATIPLLGHQAVLNRISQVKPKVLLTVDRFSFNKEETSMFEKIEEIVKNLSSLEKVIIVATKEDSKLKDISKIKNSCFLDEFLELGRHADGSIPPMKFEQVSFSYPVYVSFTSGTTGLPKPLVHGCGVFLSNARDHVVNMDSERGDVFFTSSPAGWVSWNMFITLLFAGRTVLLYEGNPYFLSPTSIWDLIDEFNITYLLIQSSYLHELEKRRYLPTKKHRLSSLKSMVAAASVVKLRAYDFVYTELKLNIMFCSFYGCSEVMGWLMVSDFTMPIYKGEISFPALGTSMECLDESGKPIFGEIGELVISKPIPSTLLYLWGDDGSKFREKYFSKYPGKFLIGDYVTINPVTKGYVICGRCDDTLKQRGCRFGSSEIYNVVEFFLEVLDSLCVSQYDKYMEERAVLFLKMKEGHMFNEQLVCRIRKAIAEELTPSHVPDVIIETGDIPYNANDKKMEVTIKNIINNRAYNAAEVKNPECLKYYINREELKGF